MLKKDNNPKSETEIKSQAKTIKNANEKLTIIVVNVKKILVIA
jgi:hypothetical protein